MSDKIFKDTFKRLPSPLSIVELQWADPWHCSGNAVRWSS